MKNINKAAIVAQVRTIAQEVTPVRVGLAVAAGLALGHVNPSFATDTPLDYGAMITGAKTELSTALPVVLGIAGGVLGTFVAIGYGFRLFKRATKSS